MGRAWSLGTGRFGPQEQTHDGTGRTGTRPSLKILNIRVKKADLVPGPAQSLSLQANNADRQNDFRKTKQACTVWRRRTVSTICSPTNKQLRT